MSALRFFLTVLLVVFAVEFGVMIALPGLFTTDMNPRWKAACDAVLLTTLCAPVIWWLLAERRRTEADGKTRAHQQAVAFDFSRRALVCEEVSQLLNEAVQSVADTLRVDFVVIWERSPEDDSLLLRAGCGWRQELIGQLTWHACLTPCAEGNTFPCSAFAERKWRGHCDRCSPLLHEHNVQSGVCIVIQGDARPFGMIGAYTAQPRKFSRDETHFLQDIALEITLAVERCRVEQRRRDQETLRADQMALVAQLATGVAHEIRNPLTSIKMLVQSNQELDSDQPLSQDDLRIIEGEIRRMERCLHTFLDFARPPKPERRPINLAVEVQRTFALLEVRAARQNVTLRFVPSTETLLVEADGGQIQQLLLNLALNALDAMPEGGTLTVTLKFTDGAVEMDVIDTGPGIAHSMRGQLFRPFATSKEKGVGLGLVISRRIAEDHGGSLTEKNHPAGGACFTLRLPLTANP